MNKYMFLPTLIIAYYPDALKLNYMVDDDLLYLIKPVFSLQHQIHPE